MQGVTKSIGFYQAVKKMHIVPLCLLSISCIVSALLLAAFWALQFAVWIIGLLLLTYFYELRTLYLTQPALAASFRLSPTAPRPLFRRGKKEIIVPATQQRTFIENMDGESKL